MARRTRTPFPHPAIHPLIAALLGATAVHAQTPRPPPPETTLPEVKVTAPEEGLKKEATSTATRTETPLRDIPQFVNTVPEALLRSQNATSLADALRNVPGISYAAAEGGTQANQVFYLRGFPAGGDLFIDGVRDLGEYNRDLFATESVDVLKGPSALMFGRGATGGIVNQVSKAAGLVPRREAALTVGSFEQKRLTADVNAPFGDSHAFRIAALAEDGGSHRYPQDVERTGVAPSLRLGIGYPTELSLSYYFLETRDVTDYGQPSLSPAYTGTGFYAMPPVSPENYYGFGGHDFARHETHIATARLEHRLNRDVTLRQTLRWANYERQVEATIATLAANDAHGQPVTPLTPLEDLVVSRRHDGNRTRDNDDTALVAQTDVTWRLDAGGVRHTVLGGLELAREKLHRWNYVLDADPLTEGVQAPSSDTSLLDPDPSTPLTYTKVPNTRARAQGDTVAVFAQDQLEFSAQWKALVGLRFERYDARARVENHATGVPTSGPFAREDDMVSGRAGLIWQPTAAQSYYVAAGNSYNPAGELGVYGGTGTNLNAGNSVLDPEENRGYEAGATWDFPAGLQLRAAVFRNEKVNARMNDGTGTIVLAGRRRVDGVELQLAGHLAPGWELYSGVAVMDGEIVTGPANVQGRDPLGVANLAGNLWTTYRLGGGWELGGGVRGTSSFWLNDANTGKVPGYAIWDATIAYVARRWEARLNAWNLGDKVHYIGGYQNSPNRVIPGLPRAVALTFRYFF